MIIIPQCHKQHYPKCCDDLHRQAGYRSGKAGIDIMVATLFFLNIYAPFRAERDTQLDILSAPCYAFSIISGA